MVNYDDLIQHDVENTSLDFKKTQYHRDVNEPFIKDIMSMANADGEDDKHIIIGVGWDDHGERQLLGIKKEDFIDPATYQQIIRENIEPDIHLEYFLHEFDNTSFPIFKLSNCSDKPYMMKKQYKKLGKGESWIRKGTHQDRMVRRDLEVIFKNKFENRGFDGEISIDFLDSGKPELEISAIREFTRPSEIAKKRIQKTIEAKKNPRPQPTYESVSSPLIQAMRIAETFRSPFYRSYNDMTIAELETALKEVDEKYYEHDLYAMFEEGATKIKLKITNHGEEYIEDGSIELTFPKKDGLLIAPEVFEKPVAITDPAHFLPRPRSVFFYPSVKQTDDEIIVKTEVGKIKHNTDTIVFGEPIRIKMAKILIGETITIQCRIIGKNLTKPIVKFLTIRVI
jgi:hypothetical protein